MYYQSAIPALSLPASIVTRLALVIAVTGSAVLVFTSTVQCSFLLSQHCSHQCLTTVGLLLTPVLLCHPTEYGLRNISFVLKTSSHFMCIWCVDLNFLIFKNGYKYSAKSALTTWGWNFVISGVVYIPRGPTHIFY